MRNVIELRPALPSSFAVPHPDRPATNLWIIHVLEDGRMWWADRCGGGKAFFSEGSDRVIVIGPYKAYGAAFHAIDDEKGKAEADREAAEFEALAATLPGVPSGVTVLHFTETEGWQ